MPDNVVSTSYILLYLLLKITLESRCCKIYERFDILPELQANKLVYHSFMNVSKKHETSGSKRKDSFITHSNIMTRVCTFSCVHILSLSSYRAT